MLLSRAFIMSLRPLSKIFVLGSTIAKHFSPKSLLRCYSHFSVTLYHLTIGVWYIFPPHLTYLYRNCFNIELRIPHTFSLLWSTSQDCYPREFVKNGNVNKDFLKKYSLGYPQTKIWGGIPPSHLRPACIESLDQRTCSSCHGKEYLLLYHI